MKKFDIDFVDGNGNIKTDVVVAGDWFAAKRKLERNGKVLMFLSILEEDVEDES